jgi:hypothetical protein
MNGEHPCNLACWTCGKKQAIVMRQAPQFAFEVATAANDIGWIGVLDLPHSRSLVFCSNECCDKAKLKSGEFRKRPPKN